METVSCFLLISLSFYFYFSGADLQFFSIHSLVIRTRDFHVGFFPSVTSVPILLGFCTCQFSHLFCLTLPVCPVSLESTSWCSCLCSFNCARTFLRQVEAILGCSVTEMLHSWVTKIYFMRRWLLWQGCVLQRGWAGCCLWEHMDCRKSGIPRTELCAQLSTSAVWGWYPQASSVPVSQLCLEIIPDLAGVGIWLPRTYMITLLLGLLFIFLFLILMDFRAVLLKSFTTDNCVINSNIFSLVIRNTCVLKDLVFS